MDKVHIILYVILFVLLCSSAYSEREVENDKFIISCDKETYFVITGDSYAYCSITNKEEGKYTTDLYAILEQAVGVKINQIDVYNGGVWEIIGTSNYQDIRTFRGKKTNTKVQINGESTMDIRIKLGVTNLGVKDEFWLGVDDLELDPAIVGCDIATDPTVYSCNDTTFIGNSIDTNLNIRIFNATIDGTAGGGIVNFTSDGWIQINQSTINGYADTDASNGIPGDFIAKAVGNIEINGSTINAYGVSASVSTPRTGGTGNVEIYSSGGDITVYSSTFNSYGGGGSCSGDTAGGGDSNNKMNGTIITINNTNINSYGGGGCASSGVGNGGLTNVKWYANQIIGVSDTVDHNWLFYGGQGQSAGAACTGTNNFLFNASKIKLGGNNNSVLTINTNKGGCSGGTANTFVQAEFNVLDEMKLDSNVSILVSGSVTGSNWSKINFTGNNNLKMMLSGISIPNPELFVFCADKVVEQNLYMLWENTEFKTQEIDFKYCSYVNLTSRYDYDFLVTAPSSPTFTSPTPSDGLNILTIDNTFNISHSGGSDIRYYIQFGNTSTLTDSNLVLVNESETGSGYRLFTTNSSLLNKNGMLYYRAKVLNNSNGLFSPYTSTRTLGFFKENVIISCNETTANSTKILTIYGKDEETDVLINFTMDMTLTYYYINETFTNETAFSLTGKNNYSFCMNVNSTFTLSGLAEFGDGITYTKRKYYFANVLVNTETSSDIYFYHLNNSKASEIIFTVFDTITGDKVEGAYVNILRYYPGENVFRLVEVSKTDETGQTLGKMVLADVFYKFIIHKPIGTVKLTTDIFRLLSLTRSFGITSATNYLDTWNKINGVSITTTCTKATKTCRVTWSDDSNIVQDVTLEVWNMNGLNNYLLSSQTTASAAGTISYTILEDTTGNSYEARSYIESNTGTSRYVGAFIGLIFPDNPLWETSGDRVASLFPLFLLVVVITFALIDFGAVGIVIGSLLGMILGSLIGILPLSPFYFVSMIVMAIILVYKLSK